MNYGLALDCIFRGCPAFRTGSNLDEIFEYFRSIDVATVEIDAYRRFERDDDIHTRKLRFLSSLEGKIAVTLHYGKHDLSSPDKERRLHEVETVCSCIEHNARFFQPELIVLHPGPPTASRAQIEERYACLRESTLELLDCCTKHNLRLVYENMRVQYPTPGNRELIDLLGEEAFERVLREAPMRAFPRTGGDISRLLQFVRSFNTDAVGICIDTGHTNISEGNVLPAKIRECGKTLHHVHMSDNFGINDNHLTPGAADIDWRSFYAALEAIEYQGTVLLEITAKFRDPSDCTTENILKLVEEDHKHYSARGHDAPQLDSDTLQLRDMWRQEGPR